MNFGIQGRRAVVCASSKGLGKACALALATEGVQVLINARSQVDLDQTTEEIGRKTGARVIAVAADITTARGRGLVLEACPEADILINNAGGPPSGDLRNWNREDWMSAVDANMFTPISLIKSVIDGMIERQFGRNINITTAGVKSPGTYPMLGLSIAARSGLTGFIGTLARQVAHANVTINGLLPGRFDTGRLRSLIRSQALSESRSREYIAAEQLEHTSVTVTTDIATPVEWIGSALRLMARA